MALALALFSSCKKTDDSSSASKKDPVISWSNPADIDFGTLLSATQLNATASVPGVFVYTPATGTKLNAGANQDLKVDFTPTDAVTYNTASKTVKINVIGYPVITWGNPADIDFGTLLSATQLNATADVQGTFVYTPPIGTKLNQGANQDLKVDFTPTDQANYYTASKTVKITVTGTSSTVTDIEGNVYHTITIGTQVWMVENLITTKYNDGSAIPLVTDGAAWFASTTPGYCWYNNDPATYKNTYGALYNWHTVKTGKLAPVGWHVPTASEWTTLTNYLGGLSAAGGKMKSTGTIESGTGLWNDPNTGATNESGFSAVPAGYRGETFGGIGKYGNWWSSTQNTTSDALGLFLLHNSSNAGSFISYNYNGFGVRCVRDF